MNKLVLGALTALALGTAALAQPAQAACFFNGFSYICRPAPGPYGWRHHVYRPWVRYPY